MFGSELANHSTLAIVEKWDEDKVDWIRTKSGIASPKRGDFLRYSCLPDETIEDDRPNLTTTLGLGILTNCLINVTTANFSAANLCAIGVGDNSTTATAGDTDLTASTNKYYEVADSTPSRQTVNVTNDTLQVVSTFASANGNFAWAEWGLIVATTGTLTSASTKGGTGTAALFNHKIAALGTKVSGASWAFTVKLTWS